MGSGQPDSLAGIPQIHRLADRRRSDWSDDVWPEWELLNLNYVARNAYERATGEEDGLDNALEAQGLHRICDAAPRTTPGTATIPVRDSRGSRASPHSWANTGQTHKRSACRLDSQTSDST